MPQNGPYGHRRSPFTPQQGQRHGGNNAGAPVGRFPPFGFQQQRQPMRPGMKGGAIYGYRILVHLLLCIHTIRSITQLMSLLLLQEAKSHDDDATKF